MCSAEDLRETRRLLDEAGAMAGVIAKIERSEAIDNVDEIIRESEFSG